MKNQTIILCLVITIIVMVVFFYFYKEDINQKLEKEREGRLQAEANCLKLIEDYVKKTNSIPESIKLQLKDLQDTYASLNPDVEAELMKILSLLDIGHNEIAIEKLAKVVEGLLKEKITQLNPQKLTFKAKLFQLIDLAVEKDIICRHAGDFIDLLLRKPRNREAHELNVKFNEGEVHIYLLAGVQVLYELAGNKKNDL